MFEGMKVKATTDIETSNQGIVPVDTRGIVEEVLTSWGKGIYTLSIKFEGFDALVTAGEHRVKAYVYTNEERREFVAEREGDKWVTDNTKNLMAKLGW